LCGFEETAEHFFFSCHIAKAVWVCFKEALGWDRVPSSFQDIFDYWVPLGCSDYHIKFFILSIILWDLWNIRNKGDREEIHSLLMMGSGKSSHLCRNGVCSWSREMLNTWMGKFREWRNGWRPFGSSRRTWKSKASFDFGALVLAVGVLTVCAVSV